MTVLFLDIDGVLVTEQSMLTYGTSKIFDKDCCEQLRRVVNATPKLKIVVSSTWRYGQTVGWLDNLLHMKAGLPEGIVVGKTPELWERSIRGDEIRAYLENFNVDHYAIVDDDDDFYKDMIPHLVHTDWQCGLTPDKADELIEMLNAVKP